MNPNDRTPKMNGKNAIQNTKCKVNSIRLIDRKTCKNNCKHFNFKNKKSKRTCEFQYT